MLTKLPDGSVRSGGPRPDDGHVHRHRAARDLKSITAVRLEVLTDDTLPHKGPGRQDNGNLHLNEFRVQAGRRARPRGRRRSAVALGEPPTRRLRPGRAGRSAMAIDGKPETAWGIYPEVGKPHAAVFEFKEPVGVRRRHGADVHLEQTHGRGT